MSRELQGVSVANGMAIAPIVHFHTDFDYIPARRIDAAAVPAEVARLDEAITATSRGILHLRHELSTTLSQNDTRIYDAQLALLHDKTVRADLVKEIDHEKINAEMALQRVIARYEKVFERMEDIVMRERAADIRDVGRQVLGALLARERSVYIAGGADYIFVADEFLPSDAGLLDRSHLRGIATARGGKYSHGAILARSLGIPAVLAVEELLLKARSGDQVILDGDAGMVLLRPTDEELARYRQLIEERAVVDRRLSELNDAEPITKDGATIWLGANVESVRDLHDLRDRSVAGVGLFRTEFAFMERLQFPAEEEQCRMYRTAIESLAAGQVLTFRTLDIGGDKPLRYFRTPEERNPVLGWRGLRISLDWPDIFFTQVRAILRAGAGTDARVRILLPMVTNHGEVRRSVDVIRQIQADLREAREPQAEHVQIGVMVEVPALAEILDLVLPLVDFVSVGTNDLVQYLLAVDRDNPRVAGMYDPYHPGVVRLLARMAQACQAAGKPVSICGEIAGDHYFTPLLIGLGFRELSMAPVFLPRVKLMVRSFHVDECVRLAEVALRATDAQTVRTAVREHCRVRWAQFLDESGGGSTRA